MENKNFLAYTFPYTNDTNTNKLLMKTYKDKDNS